MQENGNNLQLTPLEEKKYTSSDMIGFLAVVIAIFAIRFYVIDTVRIYGESMNPTYEDGELVVLRKLDHYTQNYGYGDVVVLKATKYKDYIKRIVGLPGDAIEVKDSTLYRNGEAIEEDYVSQEGYGDFEEVTVPDGEVFVMGDNRAHSKDSRSNALGTVPLSNIKGKVIFSV